MKNLLIAILLLVSVSAWGQITVTNNPSFISTGTTSTTLITLPSNVPLYTTLFIKLPSTNAGTVKFSSISSAVINESPDYAASSTIWLTVFGGRFWIKLSNSADDVEITW